MECAINLFINLVKVKFQLSNTCIPNNRQTLYGTNKGGKDKITDFGETWVG